MLARIHSDKVIKLEQITTVEELILKKRFSVRSPHARYLDISGGNFDGWYRKYNEKHRTLSRAFLGELRRLCKEQGLPLAILDSRPPPKYPAPSVEMVTPDLLPGITLTEYQLREIRSACTAEVGLIESPTGSGKSEVMAGIVKILNCPTVIIAEQKVVIDQLAERLELRKVAEEVGVFMAGRRPSGQMIIVGSIQSLVAPCTAPKRTKKDTDLTFNRKLKAFRTRLKNAKLLRAMVGKCDLLLVDEADKAVSAPYRNLVRYWFNGRRRYGFSGTFFDPAKPIQNMALMENFGTIIATASREEVQANGRIIPVEYTALAFGNPKRRHDKTAYDIAEKENIIENVQFHMLIKRLAEVNAKQDDHGVVILSGSVILGNTLAGIIDPSFNPIFIHGGTSRKARNHAIESFEKRECKVLIGSDIVKRGLDLDGGCETLILATGGKLWSEFNQMVGRSVRLNAQGIARIYDFYHMNNFYLYSHSRLRLKHIVGMKYAAKVVFPHAVIDAVKFINSRFRIPK